MGTVLLVVGIIIGGIVGITYTAFRIVKGLIHGIKGASKKVIKSKR